MIDQLDSNAASPASLEPTRGGHSDLPEMLRTIVETVGAYGCILWQVERRLSIPETSSDLKLFALSEWFPREQMAELHDLPLHKSATGLVTLTQQTINIEDIWADGRTYKDDPFLSKSGIKAMCSVPISYHDGGKGALNLYRNETVPFTAKEVIQIERMAPLVARLYQATRDKVGINLITGINELIEKARLYNPTFPLTLERIKNLLKEISELVSSLFRCFETSIFLEDYYRSPEVYELMATTWPKLFPQTVSRKGVGLTGWVLQNIEPVKIFDLMSFDKDKTLIEREYPGITWGDDLNIRDNVFVKLRQEYGDFPPPISYMAVPIMNGESVCGVMRCSFAEKIPDHFADRELRLLKLIGAQIGQCWDHWLTERGRQEERDAWRKFVARLRELNDIVNKQLEHAESKLEITPIFEKALQIAAEVVEGAEILDVRLLKQEEHSGYFYFETTYGKAWHRGGESERQKRLKTRFHLNNSLPQSAGEHVYKTRQTYVIPDVRAKQAIYQEVFPDVQRMIVAPIFRKNEVTGLFDIRGTGNRVFPEYAKHMAEVLGQLIGLSYDLICEIRDKKSLEAQRTDIAKTLAHQFNTPITQAHARVNQLVHRFKEQEALLKGLWPIRGLCGKAKRVSQNIRLFAQLAEGKTGGEIDLKTDWMKADSLIRLLKEASWDTQLLVAPRRNIRFQVDEDSFDEVSHDKHRMRELLVDKSLLEQAIFNLLDNAAKYSLPDSTIKIYAGWTGGGRFHISVQNKGIKLESSQINICKEYGWQSEQAKEKDSSGAGIGLWLIHNIMVAHGGELIPIPTSSEQITKFQLVFPEKNVR
ncbi:MAG: GAF domain-containing protein [Acidobacteria bacterium]|nr:GAF domain-containing protein [Acidobacteriota bacterium]